MGVLTFLARKQYEGTIISGVKFAEKNIPDHTENKALHRSVPMDSLGKHLQLLQGFLCLETEVNLPGIVR